MDWHVFVVFGAFFYANFFHIAHSAPYIFQTNVRGKRSPQDNGLLFQHRGSLNINIPQVASNVRKHLHNLVDTITNPLVTAQVDPMNVNYQYDYVDQYQSIDQQYQNPSSQEYQMIDQQYQNSQEYYEHPPRGHHHGSPRYPYEHPPRGPPHGHRPRGPPHGHPPRGPPHGHPPRGPPHRHPPRGPPHGHPRGPPHGHGPPFSDRPDGDNSPQYDNIPSEGLSNDDTQNLSETRPDFSQQPNYPSTGKSNADIDLSNTTPSDTAKKDEQSKDNKGGSNIVGYMEDDFPVILLNENEIR